VTISGSLAASNTKSTINEFKFFKSFCCCLQVKEKVEKSPCGGWLNVTQTELILDKETDSAVVEF